MREELEHGKMVAAGDQCFGNGNIIEFKNTFIGKDKGVIGPITIGKCIAFPVKQDVCGVLVSAALPSMFQRPLKQLLYPYQSTGAKH